MWVLRPGATVDGEEKTGDLYGGFLKWWYPKTMGFPTQNDHFGVFWGYHNLRKHPYKPRNEKETTKKHGIYIH